MLRILLITTAAGFAIGYATGTARAEVTTLITPTAILTFADMGPCQKAATQIWEATSNVNKTNTVPRTIGNTTTTMGPLPYPPLPCLTGVQAVIPTGTANK